MMKEQHTPGPWSVTTKRSTGSGQPWIAQDCNGGGVLRTIFDGDAPDVFALSEANAHLIAAAPDLLAALQGLLRLHIRPTDNPQENVAVFMQIPSRPLKVAKAAIAKAKGGA